VPRWGAAVLRRYREGVRADREIGVPGRPKNTGKSACATKGRNTEKAPASLLRRAGRRWPLQTHLMGCLFEGHKLEEILLRGGGGTGNMEGRTDGNSPEQGPAYSSPVSRWRKKQETHGNNFAE
jgi:hypothetical protein